MKRRSFNLLPADEPQEEGIVLLMVAISLMTILFLISLAVDSAKLYRDSLHIQYAADAAAMAAAQKIGDYGQPALIDLAKRVARDNLDRNGVSYDPQNLSNYVTASFLNTNEIQVQTRSSAGTFLHGKMVEGADQWGIRGTAAAMRRPVAVVIVADISGSMSDNADPSCHHDCQTKIEALKDAAKNFVSNFDESRDAVSVVSFEQHIHFNYDLQRPWVRGTGGSNSSSDVNGVINRLQAGGNTNIQGGIYAGRTELARLENFGDPQAFLKVIVLITDGSPTANHKDTDTYYPAGTPDPWPGSPCPSYTGTKEDMIYTLIEADRALTEKALLFTIGLGQRDIENGSPWQQPDNSSLLKSYLLRRIANDSVSAGIGGPHPDPDFDSRCVHTYQQNSSYPRGVYLDSPNAMDLQSMLTQVAGSIRMRLTQ